MSSSSSSTSSVGCLLFQSLLHVLSIVASLCVQHSSVCVCFSESFPRPPVDQQPSPKRYPWPCGRAPAAAGTERMQRSRRSCSTSVRRHLCPVASLMFCVCVCVWWGWGAKAKGKVPKRKDEKATTKNEEVRRQDSWDDLHNWTQHRFTLSLFFFLSLSISPIRYDETHLSAKLVFDLGAHGCDADVRDAWGSSC